MIWLFLVGLLTLTGVAIDAGATAVAWALGEEVAR